MKTLQEMKQHIIAEAKEFHSIDPSEIDWWEDVELGLIAEIIEYALNGNYVKDEDKKRLQELFDEDFDYGVYTEITILQRLYYDLILKGKVANEIVELEKLFIKEFYKEEDLEEFIKARNFDDNKKEGE